MSLLLSHFIIIYLSIYLFIHLFIYLFTYLSILAILYCQVLSCILVSGDRVIVFICFFVHILHEVKCKCIRIYIYIYIYR